MRRRREARRAARDLALGGAIADRRQPQRRHVQAPGAGITCALVAVSTVPPTATRSRRDAVATPGDAGSASGRPADAAHRRRAAVTPRPSPTTSRARSSRPARVTPPGRARSATATQSAPIRADDMFFGNAASGRPTGSTSPARRSPPADEQQRLLANLIIGMQRPDAAPALLVPPARATRPPSCSPATTTARGGTERHRAAVRRSNLRRQPPGCSVDRLAVRALDRRTSTPTSRRSDLGAAAAQNYENAGLRDRAAPRGQRHPMTAARSRSGGPTI